MFYKIFMLVAIPSLIIGWVAYAWWLRKIREEEENQPKPQSQRLVKTKTEVADWAQKMAQYKPPKIKRTYDDEGPAKDVQNNPGKAQ